MKKPSLDVTVINTVFYHTEQTVRCFKSLQKNTSYPFHLLVFVNGADKELKKWLKEDLPKMFKNIKVIFNKINIGCAHGENSCIEKVKTNYLAIIHSDMTFEKKWLTNLVRGYNRVENPAYCFSNNMLKDRRTNFHPLIRKDHYLSAERDNRYKRDYSDFDWYWKLEIIKRLTLVKASGEVS